MKLIYLALLFFFAQSHLYAQQENYFDYTIEKYKDESSFPIFHSAKDSLVCQKINLYLQLSKLSLLKGKEKKHIFERNFSERIDIIDEPYLFHVSILNNTSKILSIMFNESACGTTCFFWKTYYNFNLSSGNLLSLSDLFNKEIITEFLKITLAQRRKHFEKQVKKLKKQVLEEDKELVRNIEDITEWLNPNNKAPDPIADFYIKDSILYIDDDWYLSKNIKVSGYFDMITSIHSKDFFHLLNNYGKAVFSQDIVHLAGFQEENTYQLFVGTINQKYPITLYLEKKEIDTKTKKISISGKYAYHKYGVAIDLEGEIKGDRITLDELDKERGINAYWDLVFKEGELIGTWTDKTRKKFLTIEVKFFEVRKE